MQQAVFVRFSERFPAPEEIVRRVEERLGVKIESRFRVITGPHSLLLLSPSCQPREAADINFDSRRLLAVVEWDSPPTTMQAACVAALEAAGGRRSKG